MNAVSSYFKDLGSKLKDASGNVSKAYLCIRDPINAGKEIDLEAFDNESKVAQEAIIKEAGKKLDRANKFEDNISAASADALLKTKVRGSNSSNNLSYDDLVNLLGDKGYIPIQVQYNPSTLKFHSALGGRRRINSVEGVGSGGDSQTIKDIPKNTELSCTLIFENINVNDAFIQASEGYNASLGNVTSTLGSMAKKAFSKESAYTVLPLIEGFISLLSDSYSRDVFFYYGRLCFHGELTSVKTDYKMFNKSGDLIYAEVTIVIRQDAHNAYDQERWRTSFDALFDDGQASANVGGVIDGISSLGNTLSGGIF